MRYKESPDPGMCAPGTEDKVMHMKYFRIGETTLLASDGRCTGQPNFQGVSLTLTVADDAEAERLFALLANGGQVRMPMTKTFGSVTFVGFTCNTAGRFQPACLYFNALGHSSPRQISSEVAYSCPM